MHNYPTKLNDFSIIKTRIQQVTPKFGMPNFAIF